MGNGGDTYGYDPAAAQNAEDQVETAATNLQGSVDTLTDHMTKLASTWDGTEKEQYGQIHQKITNGLEQIGSTLTQIKETLGENTESVNNMQQKIQQTISGGK